MNLLFMHPNIPGQYKHICREFAKDPRNTVVFMGKPNAVSIPGVHKIEYTVSNEPSGSTHHYIVGAERAIHQGQKVWRECKALRASGFIPDVICAHPGWGDALYVKDVYPEVPLLSFFEFYYRSTGADVDFDPEFPGEADEALRVRTKNIINILSLESADWGVSPTHWQYSQNPIEFQHKISVLHDGIDVGRAKPNPNAEIRLGSGLVFRPGDKLVTYVARNLEPYRGFPAFMRAAEIILSEDPDVHIIVVGSDGVSYGRRLPKGQCWRHIMLEELKMKPELLSRLHFTGQLPYPQLIKLFQVSAAHVYLTYPFVLSWSLLEAMACGCAVVGSDTQPLHEAIVHNQNGCLVDFFSPDDIARSTLALLNDRERAQSLGKKARKSVVDNYALEKLLPMHMQLIRNVADGLQRKSTTNDSDHAELLVAAQ
ncbi:MAG: glycosyltransferase family 4 protein [Pseudomonadales bacterium]